MIRAELHVGVEINISGGRLGKRDVLSAAPSIRSGSLGVVGEKYI